MKCRVGEKEAFVLGFGVKTCLFEREFDTKSTNLKRKSLENGFSFAVRSEGKGSRRYDSVQDRSIRKTRRRQSAHLCVDVPNDRLRSEEPWCLCLGYKLFFEILVSRYPWASSSIAQDLRLTKEAKVRFEFKDIALCQL